MKIPYHNGSYNIATQFVNALTITNESSDLRQEALEYYAEFAIWSYEYPDGARLTAFQDGSLVLSQGNELLPLDNMSEVPEELRFDPCLVN